MTNYADYKPFTMVDGKGVRNAIYFSGCRFACLGCYNKVAQNFNYGKEFTQDIIDEILDDTDQEYVRGLSVLGGEPFQNIDAVLDLILQFREKFSNSKDIWVWTGYTIEELFDLSDDDCRIKSILSNIDILVDGRFIQSLFIKDLPFRGSQNQRIIKVKESIQERSAIIAHEHYQ